MTLGVCGQFGLKRHPHGWHNLCRGLPGTLMLYTKYISSGPHGYRIFFKVFPIICLRVIDPQGIGQFIRDLCKGPLDIAYTN